MSESISQSPTSASGYQQQMEKEDIINTWNALYSKNEHLPVNLDIVTIEESELESQSQHKKKPSLKGKIKCLSYSTPFCLNIYNVMNVRIPSAMVCKRSAFGLSGRSRMDPSDWRRARKSSRQCAASCTPHSRPVNYSGGLSMTVSWLHPKRSRPQ
jgi:hypothetical protein